MRERNVAFGTFLIALVVFFYRHLQQLFFFSLDHRHYSHFAVVPFLALYALYSDRKRLSSALQGRALRFSTGLGGSFLMTGIVGYLAVVNWWPHLNPNDHYAGIMASFLLLLLAGLTLCYGIPTVRTLSFPIGLLLFMIPLPTLVLDGVLYALQWGSAWVAGLLFELSGVPFFREDVLVFSIPGFVIEVAEECSGIRSSMALLICGVLVSHFCLRGRWQRIILITAILPLSVVKNAIRIVTLSLLAIYVDEGFMTGALHHRGGIVFFLVALALLLLLLWILRARAVPEMGRQGTGPCTSATMS